MSTNNDDWSTYSRLVLQELETLADNISTLTKEISELKAEMRVMQQKENVVLAHELWKKELSDVVSPVQLKVFIEKTNEQLDKSKSFQIKATTAFVVVQMIVVGTLALVAFWDDYVVDRDTGKKQHVMIPSSPTVAGPGR